jgi:hypothetical protein
MNGEKLSPENAKTALHLCNDAGLLLQTNHYREELGDEPFTFADCISVIEVGHIFDPAEWDDEHQEWKYRLEGFEPDGKWVNIIFSLPRKGLAKLITVFSTKPRKYHE